MVARQADDVKSGIVGSDQWLQSLRPEDRTIGTVGVRRLPSVTPQLLCDEAVPLQPRLHLQRARRVLLLHPLLSAGPALRRRDLDRAAETHEPLLSVEPDRLCSSLGWVGCGVLPPHTSRSNRTCAVNAYGSRHGCTWDSMSSECAVHGADRVGIAAVSPGC